MRPLTTGRSDRLELLQTFVCIAEAGSLSAAAAALSVSQPTVTRRVQLLEALLGLRLLDRSTRSVHLTVDGEWCLNEARQMLRLWNESVVAMQSRPERIQEDR